MPHTIPQISLPSSDEAETLDLAELLRHVAHQDQSAFAKLYRATSGKLYRAVCRVLSHGEASEVLQEAYLKIWERAGDFDASKGSPLGWMIAVARNLAIDEARRLKRQRVERMPENFEPAAVFEDPLASSERKEAYSALIRSLNALEPDKRDMILLAYYRGASREELARRFRTPVATVKTWLRRSLAQMRASLS